MAIVNIESARREMRCEEIYVKHKDNYMTCLGKYRELRGRLREGSNVQALREDLKKMDEELMQGVEKCSVLEGTLRSSSLVEV